MAMRKITYTSKHILKNGMILFIFLIIPVILFLLITSYTSIIFGIRSFDVLTGSMEPIIHTGSIILSKPALSYHIGDIITFKRNKITITHRVVNITNNKYITKGDANKTADVQTVSKANIIGKNFFSIPFVGKLIGFIKTIPGFVIFIALPTFIFIGFEAKSIKQEWEKEIEKKLLKKMEKA